MALAFFGVVGYMAYVLMGAPADTRQEEEALKEEALKYSGINPDEFRAFAREMKLAEDEKPREAAKHLYRCCSVAGSGSWLRWNWMTVSSSPPIAPTQVP